MITTTLGNKYEQLFKDAYNVLIEKFGADETILKPETIENKTITSLEEYFTYIEYFSQWHHDVVEAAKLDNAINWNTHCSEYSKFLMLPITEDYFTINLNTRQITIPTIFATHGVGLIGDARAETLLFEIDRYFDYVDLMRASIYVQWKKPDLAIDEEDADGATQISLIDYDDKKIRLGWTLTEKVTTNSTLKFSLRFFMRGDNGKVIYSLNTLPASVRIRDALRIDVNDTYTDEDPELFTEIIKNGADSNTAFPAKPEFTKAEPGNKNEAMTKINLTNDTLTLSAWAQKEETDTGVMSYTWHFTPKNTNFSSVSLKAQGLENAIHGLYTATDGTNTYCTIKPDDGSISGPITGEYYVTAVNKIRNNISDTRSKKWQIPGPEWIKYNTNLNAIGTILDTPGYVATSDTEFNNDKIYYIKDEETDTYTEFDGSDFETGVDYYEKYFSTTLQIDAISDDEDADLKYNWYLTNTQDGEMSKIVENGNTTQTITTPGWYKAEVISTLNRDSMSADSTVAKVTFAPVAPTFDHLNDDHISVINFSREEGSLILAATAQLPDGYRNNVLYCEDITYKWFCKVTDSEEEYEVQEGLYGATSIVTDDNGTSKLTLNADCIGKLFYCIATNELNGHSAESEESSDQYIII